MPAPVRATKSTIKTLSPEERIRRRAYELYVDRGNQSGSELDDWLQAEEEILQAQDEALDENGCGRGTRFKQPFLQALKFGTLLLKGRTLSSMLVRGQHHDDRDNAEAAGDTG